MRTQVYCCCNAERNRRLIRGDQVMLCCAPFFCCVFKKIVRSGCQSSRFLRVVCTQGFLINFLCLHPMHAETETPTLLMVCPMPGGGRSEEREDSTSPCSLKSLFFWNFARFVTACSHNLRLSKIALRLRFPHFTQSCDGMHASIRNHAQAYTSTRKHIQLQYTQSHASTRKHTQLLSSHLHTRTRKHTQAHASTRRHTQAHANIHYHTQSHTSTRKHAQAFITIAITCYHTQEHASTRKHT